MVEKRTFVKGAKLMIIANQNQFVKTPITVKKSAAVRAALEPCRVVVVVGGTFIKEEGMAAIVGRDKRYHVCGGAHGFYDGCELIRKHQPDDLLIEPFLEDRGRPKSSPSRPLSS
jgi:hypothetical protein